MAYQPMAPCAQCARHVRTTEPNCPFCGATLAAEQLAARVIPSAGQRLSRSAMAVFASTLALSACGTTVNGDGGTPGDSAAIEASANDSAQASDAATSDNGPDQGGPVAAYGGPMPVDAAGPDVGDVSIAPLYGDPMPRPDAAMTDDGPDQGGPVAAYGGPMPVDAGRDSGGFAPLYGAVPPDGG